MAQCTQMEDTESGSKPRNILPHIGTRPINAVWHHGDLLFIDKAIELTLQGFAEDNALRDMSKDSLHIRLHEPRSTKKPLSKISSMQVNNDMTSSQIRR